MAAFGCCLFVRVVWFPYREERFARVVKVVDRSTSAGCLQLSPSPRDSFTVSAIRNVVKVSSADGFRCLEAVFQGRGDRGRGGYLVIQ